MLFRSNGRQEAVREQFALTAGLDEIRERFDIVSVKIPYEPLESVAPTEHVPIIVGRRRERRLVDSRWGLFPFWAKDSVHAEMSGVLRKPVFHRLLKKQRCIVPGTALRKIVEGSKSSRTISLTAKNNSLFGMAGLYEERVDPRGTVHRSFTIMTAGTDISTDDLQPVMPLVLGPEEQEAWLDPDERNVSDWLLRLRPKEDDRWIVRVEHREPYPIFHD